MCDPRYGSGSHKISGRTSRRFTDSDDLLDELHSSACRIEERLGPQPRRLTYVKVHGRIKIVEGPVLYPRNRYPFREAVRTFNGQIDGFAPLRRRVLS